MSLWCTIQKAKNTPAWLFSHLPGALHRVSTQNSSVTWLNFHQPSSSLYPHVDFLLFHYPLKCHSKWFLSSSRLRVKPSASVNSPSNPLSHLGVVWRENTEVSSCLKCLEHCLGLCMCIYREGDIYIYYLLLDAGKLYWCLIFPWTCLFPGLPAWNFVLKGNSIDGS